MSRSLLLSVLLVEPTACASVRLCRAMHLLTSPLRLPPIRCAEAGPSPEKWREFRASLISGGIRVVDEMGEELSEDKASEGGTKERVVVAADNEVYLRPDACSM